jgi:hypothetical protein
MRGASDHASAACVKYGIIALWERVDAMRSIADGSVSADRDPSSGADFIRATFSHKGRVTHYNHLILLS